MATYRIDSQFTIVSTERGYDVYDYDLWVADCTTRAEADRAIERRLAECEGIRVSCERPTPYGC